MSQHKKILSTTTALPILLGLAVGAPATLAVAIGDAAPAYAQCNPCAAKKVNPCNPCNPCAAKKSASACNPCAAKNPCAAQNASACSPCNPCAAKKKKN